MCLTCGKFGGHIFLGKKNTQKRQADKKNKKTTEFVSSWIWISASGPFSCSMARRKIYFQAEGIAKLRPAEGPFWRYLIWDHSFASMSHWHFYKHRRGAWTYLHLKRTRQIRSSISAKAGNMSHTFGIMWSNGSSLANTSLASRRTTRNNSFDHEKWVLRLTFWPCQDAVLHMPALSSVRESSEISQISRSTNLCVGRDNMIYIYLHKDIYILYKYHTLAQLVWGYITYLYNYIYIQHCTLQFHIVSTYPSLSNTSLTHLHISLPSSSSPPKYIKRCFSAA